MKNIIQIAGIIDQDEATMLVAEGVDYLGFPLRLRDGGEDLPEIKAKRIISSLRSYASPVIITYLDNADEIARFCRDMGITKVQLHGPTTNSEIKKLSKMFPGLFIIKSLIVRDTNLSELQSLVGEVSSYVGAFITDTFDPATGLSGATGKVHDWSVSRSIVELSRKPVILAGGLTADNVKEAILKVRPAGVDSHTGVEGTDGRKKRELVRKFVSEAKKGFELMRTRHMKNL
jgi:phosphoribosylanthranilate isomerase